MTEATRHARRMADYAGLCNNWTYNQILRFNFKRNAKATESLEQYARTEVQLLGEVGSPLNAETADHV